MGQNWTTRGAQVLVQVSVYQGNHFGYACWWFCSKNSRPWFAWWFHHLPGPSNFQKGDTYGGYPTFDHRIHICPGKNLFQAAEAPGAAAHAGAGGVSRRNLVGASVGTGGVALKIKQEGQTAGFGPCSHLPFGPCFYASIGFCLVLVPFGPFFEPQPFGGFIFDCARSLKQSSRSMPQSAWTTRRERGQGPLCKLRFYILRAGSSHAIGRATDGILCRRQTLTHTQLAMQCACIYIYIYNIYIYIYIYVHIPVLPRRVFSFLNPLTHCCIAWVGPSRLLGADPYLFALEDLWKEVTETFTNEEDETVTETSALEADPGTKGAELRDYHPCEVAKNAGGVFGNFGGGAAVRIRAARFFRRDARALSPPIWGARRWLHGPGEHDVQRLGLHQRFCEASKGTQPCSRHTTYLFSSQLHEARSRLTLGQSK